MFSAFIQHIKKRLHEPLPGFDVIKDMAVPDRLRLIAEPNEHTRKSAVLILFYPDKGRIYLPLILRPAYDGVHGGQMAFPGGRQEKEDENLYRTALREAQEEIGIKAIDVTVLGNLSEIYIPPSNFWVLPVIGYMNQKPEFYPDAREVDKVFEISLNELQDPAARTRRTVKSKEKEFETPCIIIQDSVIWGATALMIAELLAVVGEVELRLWNKDFTNKSV